MVTYLFLVLYLVFVFRKYAEEVDEKYSMGDLVNLGDKQQLVQKLDDRISAPHYPVRELEPAWAIDRQFYNTEPDQVSLYLTMGM